MLLEQQLMYKSRHPNYPFDSNFLIRTDHLPTMASYYSGADLKHTLAHLAPKARPLYVQVDFEVFGNIHGVNFTKYAKEMSQKLGVNGWIRFNNKRGSVIGQVEGEKDKVDQMALWLKLQGSPGSKIEHCDFKGWQIVDARSFRDFKIRF